MLKNAPMRVIRPDSLERSDMYFLLNSVIVPRPIAWVSTVSSSGTTNLAPHSYSTVAGVVPPTLAFVSLGRKHTVSNVSDTGCFVVHVVDQANVEPMNVSAIDAPQGVSEIDVAGLTAVAADVVAAPRVAEAPVALECTLERIVEVGSEPAYMVLGQVVAVHVAERLFDARGRVDPGRLDAVARLGGSGYSTITDRFELRRPRWADDETLQEQYASRERP